MLTLIGYWRNDRFPALPDPEALIDEQWNSDERDIVVNYFHRGTVARAFMGPSACRICGIHNGSVEYTDGQFIWPEGFAHYIGDHNVRPPADVVKWAIERMETIEQASIDGGWVDQRNRFELAAAASGRQRLAPEQSPGGSAARGGRGRGVGVPMSGGRRIAQRC